MKKCLVVIFLIGIATWGGKAVAQSNYTTNQTVQVKAFVEEWVELSGFSSDLIQIFVTGTTARPGIGIGFKAKTNCYVSLEAIPMEGYFTLNNKSYAKAIHEINSSLIIGYWIMFYNVTTNDYVSPAAHPTMDLAPGYTEMLIKTGGNSEGQIGPRTGPMRLQENISAI